MTDTAGIAAFLSAMAEAPARLAALERVVAELSERIGSIQAVLPPALATVPEAAQRFKVSIPTMRRWVKNRMVPTVKIGNTVRVDLSRLHGTDAAGVAKLAAEARRGPTLGIVRP